MRPETSASRLRNHLPSTLNIVVSLVAAAAVLFGCGAASSVAKHTGGAHGASTPTNAPYASPTNAPITYAPTATTPPQPHPTNTAAPTPPYIGGSYGGNYYSYSNIHGNMPLILQISQSGSSLTGISTEREGAVVTADTGSIGLNGAFTLTEKLNGMLFGVLTGSIAGPGHLSGTWSDGGAAQGGWDVYNPPRPLDLHGTYTGTYTVSGSSTSYPMTLAINTVGWTFTGTTTEGSLTYNDTGTITENGSLSIDEGGPVLTGGVVGYGQLQGTWATPGGSNGTWSVLSELF